MFTFEIDTNPMDNNPDSYQNMINIINSYTSKEVIKTLNPYPFSVTTVNIVKNSYFSGYKSLKNFPTTRPLNTMLDNESTSQLNNIIDGINRHHNINAGMLGKWLREHINTNMRLIYSIKGHENVSEEKECIESYIINLNNEMFGFDNLNINDIIYNSKKGESWINLEARQKKINEFKNTKENRRNLYGMAYEVLEHVYGMNLDRDKNRIVPFSDSKM